MVTFLIEPLLQIMFFIVQRKENTELSMLRNILNLFVLMGFGFQGSPKQQAVIDMMSSVILDNALTGKHIAFIPRQKNGWVDFVTTLAFALIIPQSLAARMKIHIQNLRPNNKNSHLKLKPQPRYQ